MTPANTTVKFNQLVAFKCPYCGAEIILYVAASKLETGEEGLQISVDPIEADWLEKNIASFSG